MTTTTRRDPLAARDGLALASEGGAARKPNETIDPAIINGHDGTQMRAGLNRETVASYAELMRESGGWGVFPPVMVFHDGTNYWLADGFHRVAAYEQASLAKPIPAIICAGARRDAILHAAGANAAHGLPRTNADKRRAVETLLRDEEWGQWSDREIARRCHVSNRFVGDVRGDLLTVNGTQSEPNPAQPSPTQRTYTTRHGTQATMNTTGQREAAQQRHKPAPPPARVVYVEPETAFTESYEAVAQAEPGASADDSDLEALREAVQALIRLERRNPARAVRLRIIRANVQGGIDWIEGRVM